MRHCRWVDEVVPDAPWVIDEAFLQKVRMCLGVSSHCVYIAAWGVLHIFPAATDERRLQVHCALKGRCVKASSTEWYMQLSYVFGSVRHSGTIGFEFAYAFHSAQSRKYMDAESSILCVFMTRDTAIFVYNILASVFVRKSRRSCVFIKAVLSLRLHM